MRVRRPDGVLTVVAGASRSGKTAWTRGAVAGFRRLLVWDLLGEWGGDARFNCVRSDSLALVRDWIKAGDTPGRLAYFRPGMVGDFDAFCRLAWLWIQAGEGALVVEETASVTSPGKAPPAWGDLLRAGLRYGPRIFALTQRPAESDKTALGNATVIHCHRMSAPRDRAYMAEALGVPVLDVENLTGYRYLERHASGRLVRGPVRGALRENAHQAAAAPARH